MMDHRAIQTSRYRISNLFGCKRNTQKKQVKFDKVQHVI